MKQWDGEDRREHEGWHLDKRISVTHLFTTATVILAVIAGYYDLRSADVMAVTKTLTVRSELEHTVELLKQKEETQKQRDATQDLNIAKIYDEVLDAKQEFRDQHTQTRKEVAEQQQETRRILLDVYKLMPMRKDNEKYSDNQ